MPFFAGAFQYLLLLRSLEKTASTHRVIMENILPSSFEQPMNEVLGLLPPFLEYHKGMPETDLIARFGQITLSQIRKDRSLVQTLLVHYFAIQHPEHIPGEEWVRMAEDLARITREDDRIRLITKMTQQANTLLNTYIESQGGMVVGILPRLVLYLVSGRVPGLIPADHPVFSAFLIDYDPSYLGWSERVNEAIDELGYGSLYESEAIYFWRLYCRQKNDPYALPPRNLLRIKTMLAPLLAQCQQAAQQPESNQALLIETAMDGFTASEELLHSDPLLPAMMILSMQLQGEPEIQISSKTGRSLREVLTIADSARATLLERAHRPDTTINRQDAHIFPLLNAYFDSFRQTIRQQLHAHRHSQIATYLLAHFTLTENMAYGLAERLQFCQTSTETDIRFTRQNLLPPSPPDRVELERIRRALHHWKGDPGLADAFFYWSVVSEKEDSEWIPVPLSIREIQDYLRPYIPKRL